MDPLIAILCIVTLIGAFMTLESEKRTRAMLGLFIANATIGIVFIALGAIYAGLFQLAIYAGVLVILFLSTSALLEDELASVTPTGELGGTEA